MAFPNPTPILDLLLVDASGQNIASADAWAAQRQIIRDKWQARLGEFPSTKVPLQTEVLATKNHSGYIRQHVRYQIEEGVTTEAYLLTPISAAKLHPAVVVFHQTSASNFRQAAGLDDSIPELQQGLQLVQRGYIVLCPQCFIYTNGGIDFAGIARNTEQLLKQNPNWTGMGRMTWDAIRAADFLESLPAVDPKRLGCIGHSLGAKEVLYAAAFDERYQVSVFNEGGIGLRFTNWKADWFLGAQIDAPDFAAEHHEMIALIAPRAFLLMAGDSEDDDEGLAFFEAAQKVYDWLGVAENISWLNHKSGHRYSPEARAKAEAFLDAHLKPRE